MWRSRRVPRSRRRAASSLKMAWYVRCCCNRVGVPGSRRQDITSCTVLQTVFVHGFSRVVCELLLKAAKKRHFTVITTEGRPDDAG